METSEGKCERLRKKSFHQNSRIISLIIITRKPVVLSAAVTRDHKLIIFSSMRNPHISSFRNVPV